jgi:hypothetical protein
MLLPNELTDQQHADNGFQVTRNRNGRIDSVSFAVATVYIDSSGKVTWGWNDATLSLTTTSKMPCASWNLPAGKTCPGARKCNNAIGLASICQGCYADNRGNYRYTNVKNAMDLRLSWITKEDATRVVCYLTAAVYTSCIVSGEWLFRGHDSGDLFSEAYISQWVRVAKNLPEVDFWFPTREWVRESQVHALRQLGALPNVALRPSAVAFNAPAPIIAGFAYGTSVYSDLDLAKEHGHAICPAVEYAGSCREAKCRKCWTDKNLTICYPYHTGKKSLPVASASDAKRWQEYRRMAANKA